MALLLALPTLCSAGSIDEAPPFSPPGAFLVPAHFAEQDGATLYRGICQGCHMADARGAQGAGMYPALAANARLASADYPIMTVLEGRHGMPPFGPYLSDAQVAAVVNYVRSHFDNHYGEVATSDVAELRRKSTPAGGAP